MIRYHKSRYLTTSLSQSQTAVLLVITEQYLLMGRLALVRHTQFKDLLLLRKMAKMLSLVCRTPCLILKNLSREDSCRGLLSIYSKAWSQRREMLKLMVKRCSIWLSVVTWKYTTNKLWICLSLCPSIYTLEKTWRKESTLKASRKRSCPVMKTWLLSWQEVLPIGR